MNPITAEATHIVPGSPEEVYAIIADYREGHPAILPRPYFTDMKVEKGGRGEGTEIVVNLNVFGARRTYHMTVREPEPGRVLVEEDAEAGVATTFTVDAAGKGQSRVTIATRSRPSPGLKGTMERLFNPAITRHIFRKELRQLADRVESQGESPVAKTGPAGV